MLSSWGHYGTLFYKFLENVISLFCGVTDTRHFGLLVTSSLGFKARLDPSLNTC